MLCDVHHARHLQQIMNNSLSDFEKNQEERGAMQGASGQSLAPEISLREWFDGTKQLLAERRSYKHRLEVMLLVGAEPIFDGTG